MAEVRVDTRAPEMTSEAPGVYRGADTQVADAAERLGGVVNEFSKRYGAWQNHIAITQAGTQLEARLQQAKTALDQSPHPLDTWNQISSGYGEAVDTAVEGHNPVVATHIKEMYDRAHIGLQAYAQATIYKHTKVLAADALHQASTQGSDSVYADTNATDTTLAALKSSYMGQVGTLYPDQASAQSDYEEAAGNVVQAGVAKFLANKDFAGAQAYVDKYGNHLSPTQETAAKYKIEELHRRQNEISRENADAMMPGILDQILKTGGVPAAKVAEYNHTLSDPENSPYRQEGNQAIQAAKKIYAESSKWKWMPSASIQSSLADLIPPDPENHAATHLYNAAQAIGRRIIKLRTDDPGQAAENAGYTTPDARVKFERSLGLADAPLTNIEAGAVANELNNHQSAPEFASDVSTLQHGLGKNFPAAWKQISKQGKLPEYLALVPSATPQGAELLLQSKDLPLKVLKDRMDATSGNTTETKTLLSRAYKRLPTWLNAMPQTEANIGMQRDAIGKLTLMEAEKGTAHPVDAAYQDLYGNYELSNGAIVPKSWLSAVPAMSAGQITTTAHGMVKQTNMPLALKAQVLKGYRLVLSPNEDGYEVQTDNGPVKIDGKPLSLGLSHIFTHYERNKDTIDELIKSENRSTGGQYSRFPGVFGNQ